MQYKLLRLNKPLPSRPEWVPFPGPYIAMVVPALTELRPVSAPTSDYPAAASVHPCGAKEHRRLHRFLVLVQNLSPRPAAFSFHLEGMPFASVHYSLNLARGVAPGMALPLELSVAPPTGARGSQDISGVGGGGGGGGGGEYQGAVVMRGSDGQECCRCPVYLRVVATEETALVGPGGLPRPLPPGSLSLRAHTGDGGRERAALVPIPVGQATCRSTQDGPALRRGAELVSPLNVPEVAGGFAALRDAALLSPSAKRARRPAVMRTQAMAPLAAPTVSAPTLSWRDALSGSNTPRVENRLAMY